MPAVATPYTIAAIHYREKALLQSDEYTRIIEAPTIHEALEVLLETPYGEWLHTDLTSNQAFAALTQHLVATRDWLTDYLPDKDISRFLTARYDGLNVATALLEKKQGAKKPGELSPLGFIDHTLLYSTLWNDLGWEYVPEFWRAYLHKQHTKHTSTATPGWQTRLLHETQVATLNWMDQLAQTPLMHDIVRLYRDRLWLDTLLRTEMLPGTPLTPLAKAELTATTPTAVIVRRLHDAGYKSFTEPMVTDLREQQDAAMYERAWDTELLRLLQPHRFVSAGYDPIIAFWFAKELEVTNLRILLGGKLNNFSVDRLYSLQRPLYLTARL